MNKDLSRRLFVTAIGCAGLARGGEVLRCAVCEAKIQGDYRIANGKKYCSKACLWSTLDPCEICQMPVQKGFVIAQHTYCKTCMETYPSCFSCGLPAEHPTRLADGRKNCRTCMRWSVKDQTMAQKHYDRARRQLEAWTSLKLKTVPKLELVDQTEMRRLAGSLRQTDSPVSIRGLYSRQVMMTKKGLFGTWHVAPELDQEKIYIIDHLHDTVFRVAATHELMHDVIHEYFPRLKAAPLWVHEGICQQASAELCRRRNYADVLYGIEHSLDPDYGDGFRYLTHVAGFDGWYALRKWMETVAVDALPDHAPVSF